MTYWALAEMVRGRAGILEGEDRASALSKLHQTVENYVPLSDDSRFVEPRLAHLIGLEERTAPDKADLFAGWRLFFERLSEANPVVMVFEDIQWADPSLIEFLDYLLEWSRNFPIFVMTLGRPGAEGASLAGPKRNTTSIYLEPLPAPAMEQLLTGLVPGLPAELTGKILSRAEGVPLYAVETVRMLLDRGLLKQEGSVYRPTGPIHDLEVPETLHALIAARLDGLTQDERRLVQDASVLGKTFTRAALAAVSGLPERQLEPLLASLLAKEVLSVQADPRSPERGQYGFLQDLVRTVAYETLSKRDRKQKHLQVAEYLERAWGEEEEEIVEVVASHYVEAYRLSPDAEDAAEIRDRARRMLVRAAERAASLAAGEEAATYFLQSADLATSTLEKAELIERAGQMELFGGRPEEAERHYEEAGRLFEQAGQHHPAARVEARLAEVDFLHNRIDRAVERLQSAYAVMSGDEPDPDLAMVAAQLGRFLAIGGRWREALAPLDQALLLAEHLELRELYSHALSSKAIGLLKAGRLDEGSTLLRRALEVALEHGYMSAAFRAYNNLSVVLEALDRFHESMVVTEQALALARRTGDRFQEQAWLLGSLTTAMIAGRWKDALSWVEQGTQGEAVGSLEWIESGLVGIVPIQVHRGDLGEARRLLDRFSSLAGGANPELQAHFLFTHAMVLRAEGRPLEALEAAGQAVDLRDDVGMTNVIIKLSLVEAVDAALDLGDVARGEEFLRIVEAARPGQVTPYLRAQASRLAARLAGLRGDADAVEPGFSAAERGFRELRTPFDLGVALLEHAEWLIEQGRGVEAEPLLDEGREVFERLEARPWLERLARAAEEAPASSLAQS